MDVLAFFGVGAASASFLGRPRFFGAGRGDRGGSDSVVHGHNLAVLEPEHARSVDYGLEFSLTKGMR